MDTDAQLVLDQLAAQTIRAELVVTLGALHDVLLKFDVDDIDRHYVDFEALGERLQECIDKVEEVPSIDG